MDETEEKPQDVKDPETQNGAPMAEATAAAPAETVSSEAASSAASHWATAGLRLRAQLDAEVERLYTLYRDKRAFRNSAFAIGLPEELQSRLTGLPEEIQSKLAGLPDEVHNWLPGLPEELQNKLTGIPEEIQSRLTGLPEDIQSSITASASKILQKRFANTSRFVVSSKVWLNTIPTRDCDVLMTFPAKTEDSTLMWVLSRLRSQTPELAVHVRHHSNTGFYGFYLTANYENLLKGAEELAIRKQVKQDFGGGMKEFVFEDQEYFEGVEEHTTFLTSQERQSIVKNMLYNLRAVEGDTLNKIRFLEGQAIVPILLSKGVIQKVLPLHNNDDLTQLKVNWVQAFTKTQPLDKICAYFGVKIAMYFAYLGHYTKSLCFPAFLGLFFWLLSGHNQARDDFMFVSFALINVVWSTLYLEHWKRRSAEHAYNWGTLDREDELLVEPRPLFTGDLEKSAVTGRQEPVYPAWKRNLFRYFISVPIICVCLSVVFITMWMIFHFQDMINLQIKEGDLPAFCKFFPKILLAVCIGILDDIYKKIAFWLNDMENYRLDDAYENHLIIKLVLFQSVNSFLSLFYIAFYLRDMDRLRDQLAALLITRQVIGNIKEALVPYIIGKARLYKIGYKMTEGMSPDTLDRQMKEMTGEKEGGTPQDKGQEKQQEKAKEEVISDKADTATEELPAKGGKEDMKIEDFDEEPSQADSTSSSLDGLNIAQSGPQLTQAEVEASMKVYEDTFEDYLEMLVQYGYVILFSSAFPMAAMCALLNNVIEIRSDAFKLVTTFQRPFGQAVESIGTWQDALELMSLIAIIVNCALIGMSGLADRMFPNMGTTERILFIVMLEHIILALRMCLAYAIPDVPHWVAEEKARLEFLRREALKKLECKTISSPTSPVDSGATRPSSLLIKPVKNMSSGTESVSHLVQRHVSTSLTTSTTSSSTTTSTSPATSNTSKKEL